MTRAIEVKEPITELTNPWDIIPLNAMAIRADVELLAGARKFQKISKTNQLTARGDVYVEKGAVMEHCVINAAEGPVYIGKDALVMEGSLIRGPVSIGEGAVIKMGTRIYGATTIGPRCIAGGEIKNSVMFSHSNKAHDGYLGDAVIGSWCNLGAGTSNSNLKNNASAVLVWSPKGQVNAGLKCGMLMGDYSRTAINTSINTGTVIGVSVNVFGAGLTPKYIPSFSWGSEGINRYTFDKALQDIGNWKALKQETVTDQERTILKHIFDHY